VDSSFPKDEVSTERGQLLAGVAHPPWLQGRSLLPLAQGEVDHLHDEVFPPVVIARQANIAQGPQQVNNEMMPSGLACAGAGENEKPQNKLLEAQNAERLDFGTAAAAVGSDPAMATVGACNGAEVRRR
jgi:hypothetical protein